MHPRRVARDPGDRARQAAVQAYLDQHGPGAPDKGPRDECGVFGIYGHPDAAQVTFSGLLALQHRGQESAGIVSSDGIRHYVHKGMGLVGDVFGSALAAEGIFAFCGAAPPSATCATPPPAPPPSATPSPWW